MNKTRLISAIGVATLMGMSAEPTIALTTTGNEFVAQLRAQIESNNVDNARLLLRKLHALGIASLRFSYHKPDLSIETLINWLSNSAHNNEILDRLSYVGIVRFVGCSGKFDVKINMAAPPPSDEFPVSSSGVCL